MDIIRTQLKTLNRQQGLYSKIKTMMMNNLIALLDQTYPGVNALFDSPVRFSESKAAEIYAGAQDLIAMLPKDALTKIMIRQAIDALNAVPNFWSDPSLKCGRWPSSSPNTLLSWPCVALEIPSVRSPWRRLAM